MRKSGRSSAARLQAHGPLLVRCERAAPTASHSFADTLDLSHTGTKANLRLRIENITDPIVRNLRDRARDLVRIAAYVYSADTSLKRWTPKDVFADSWVRQLHFTIPVLDIEYWSAPQVATLLRDTLELLTGDVFTFEFARGSPAQGQLYLEFSQGPTPPCDLVTLVSGGLDSLAAIIDQVHREGRKPVLVSHRSAPLLDSRQKRLVELLRKRFVSWSFPQVSIWVNRAGARAVEQTQRSRAFLYLSLATAVAVELGIEEVRICDNGIVSLNLPRSGQNVGTLVTRSTHPTFLRRFQELVQDVFGTGLRIVNPFLFRTKPEVVGIVRGSGHAELIQEAVSCSRTEGMTKMQPHCGTCSQCVDRRFSTIIAGVEEHDLASRYQKDIFRSPLVIGEERTHAETYCRFAIQVATDTDDGLLMRYPEIQDAVADIPGSTDEIARALVDLHRRHANGVLEVLRRQTDLHWQDFIAGRLPESCLIAMLGRLDHLRNDRASYARRLGGLLGHALPKAFRSKPPTKESHVQDVAEAVFSAAIETLKREVPQLPFGAVTTRPDFASLQDALFVEMKLVTSRASLRRVTTEVTSRIVIYRQQGAYPLFVVYDPKRIIPDDDAFRRDLEQTEGVWVAVAR